MHYRYSRVVSLPWQTPTSSKPSAVQVVVAIISLTSFVVVPRSRKFAFRQVRLNSTMTDASVVKQVRNAKN